MSYARTGPRGSQGLPGGVETVDHEAPDPVTGDLTLTDDFAPRDPASWPEGNAHFPAMVGAGTARTTARLRSGEPQKLCGIGDSVTEALTVTNPLTDGFLIRLAAALSARFGVAVTQANHGTSGFTTLRAFTDGNLAAAIAEKADVYFIAWGKNDIGSDINGQYAPGYPLAQSIAALERQVRLIRDLVPKADIVIWSENPYTPGSSSNPYLLAYSTAMRRVAAAYGCEYVDCYAAFTALGDWSAQLWDSTHPNTAGHQLIADTLAASFPATGALAPTMPGKPAATGLYGPENVDTSGAVSNYGVPVSLATGAALEGGSWVNVGTWSGTGGSNPYTTSTPGDHADFAFTGVGLNLLMSTALADALVADVVVDGVTVAANQDFTLGKQGTYYIPIAVGLTPGPHTVSLILRSGSLKIQRRAVTVSPPAFVNDRYVSYDLTGTVATTTIDGTGAVTKLVDGTVSGSVPLPVGWGSMDVVFSGYVNPRVQGGTATNRQMQFILRRLGTGGGARVTLPGNIVAPLATTTPVDGKTIAYTERGVTASTTWNLEATVVSTDKSLCQVTQWSLKAKCYRTG
jgi:lysophospholipase L1-like esterase